jgi:hypothetical protein
MSARNHDRLVTSWLLKLATLVAATIAPEDLKQRVVSMGTLLGDDFPDDRTWSADALRTMVAQFRYWPSYIELHDALGAWWAVHRPEPVRLIPQDIEHLPLSLDDKLWIKFWRKRVLESFSNSSGATVLGMIRERYPAAYDWLVANDPDAEGVARARGWPMIVEPDASMRRAQADWRDPAKVRASVARIGLDHPMRGEMLRLLRALVTKHCPENMALVPDPEPVTRAPRPLTVAQQAQALGVTAPPPPPRGQLTPDQLSAARRAAKDRGSPTGWVAPWEREV